MERVWKQGRSESGKFVEILQRGRGDGMESGMVIDRIMAMAEESIAWGEVRKNRGMNAPASRGSRQAVSWERGNLREKADFSALPRNDKGCLVALTRKQRGEMAEAAFLAKAAGLGFAVAKPWGESSRYDLIVDNGVRLLRVQVKSAHRAGEYGGYTFHAHGNTSQVYRSTEIDLLVAYVVPLEAWYLFPVEEFRKYKSMKLFPGSRRRGSKFEKFREAWWIMR